jgi:putative oxidoreductase
VLSTILDLAGWLGLGLLSLIFLANALGVIAPETAVRELAATGVSERIARAAVLAGRVFQIIASPALFVASARPFAAIGLGLFLVPATLAAHAFWRASPATRDMQLAGFLKNAAIIGGLVMAATWRTGP